MWTRRRFEILLQSCDCGFLNLSLGVLVCLLGFSVDLLLGDPDDWSSWSLLLGYLRVYLHLVGQSQCSIAVVVQCFLPRGGGFLLIVNWRSWRPVSVAAQNCLGYAYIEWRLTSVVAWGYLGYVYTRWCLGSWFLGLRTWEFYRVWNFWEFRKWWPRRS